MAKHDPDLSLLFHALADPTRRSILTRLAETPARVTDLAGPTGL
ncbi:helix-turn-helix transcriptional regulator, partial [Mesorhizobium sp.]